MLQIDVFGIQTINDSIFIMRRSFVGLKDVIAIRMVFFNKPNDSLIDKTKSLIASPESTTKKLATLLRENMPRSVILNENFSFWRYFTFVDVSFMLLEKKKTITDDITML